jgi:hypothetical protein
MTPVCHIESAPRVPGCELRGKRPHDYGRGRVCSLPGCTTILRRTHKGPVCDPCINDDAKARARASACGAPAPTAAPATRSKKEEKVARTNGREAVLTVFARDPSRCFNASDVQKSCGIALSAVYKNLKALAASGEIVKDAPGVYRWPKIEDAKTAPASPPAPDAPVIPPPEQPANVAPASDPLPPQAGLAPFASIDYELVVIGEVVRRIASLPGHETRVRVAAYVASRFL